VPHRLAQPSGGPFHLQLFVHVAAGKAGAPPAEHPHLRIGILAAMAQPPPKVVVPARKRKGILRRIAGRHGTDLLRQRGRDDLVRVEIEDPVGRDLLEAVGLVDVQVAVVGPLEDTLAFLSKPETWADNSRGGEFDDQALARIQFAGALVDAISAGLVPAAALPVAARLVASDQQADGSWQLDDSNSVGSPATYGTALATWSARRTLIASRLPELRPAVARADAWIRTQTPQVLPDLAATLLMLADATDEAGVALRRDAVTAVLANQHRSGGWGPYPTVRPEPFDTAIAVMALARQTATPGIAQAIDRGLAWLRESALPDGSWLETTRPAGQRSYAQLISTTGWAATALLTVDNDR